MTTETELPIRFNYCGKDYTCDYRVYNLGLPIRLPNSDAVEIINWQKSNPPKPNIIKPFQDGAIPKEWVDTKEIPEEEATLR